MKEELRKKIMKMRKNLSKFEVSEKSNQIKKRLFEMDEFKQAYVILFYVSYDNEVYTHEMIKECISFEKNVVVPVTDMERRRLLLSRLKNWNDLVLGAYNILEPKEDCIEEISLERVDLILVPGVGFDNKGRRIGHGKGYYDNLLRNSTKALHVGLAFECQIVDHVPTEEHDVPLDKIVTEKRIIDCRKTK